jgi:hypothetical protein
MTRRERIAVGAIALCVSFWLVWTNVVVGEAPTASFLAAARSLPPRTRVVIQPPWRSDVEAALSSVGVDATTTLNPTAGDAFPAVVVLADRRWPIPRGWRVLHPHAKDGDVVLWSP